GQLLEERRLQGRERAYRGQLDDGLDLVLEQHRQHDHILRHHLERGRADRDRARRHLRNQQTTLVCCALTDQALADLDPYWVTVRAVVRVGRQELQRARFFVDLVDHAQLRVDERRELAQQQPADRGEIALALQHVGEAREVGLEPVLFGVAVGG